MTLKADIKNLYGAEALKKVLAVVESENVCLFASNLSQKESTVRPMSTLKIDEAGNMWFFTAKNSQKNKNIQADPAVELLYSNHSCSEYLSIYGKAEVITNKNIIKAFLNTLDKTWYHGDVSNIEICLIKVTPEQASMGHKTQKNDFQIKNAQNFN